MLTEYSNRAKAKPVGYWVRLAAFIIVGSVLASWIGRWDCWIDFRYKVYQSMQGVLPRTAYDRDTVLVLIGDEEYWRGELARRVPIKRDYIGKLVRALDEANSAIIMLD